MDPETTQDPRLRTWSQKGYLEEQKTLRAILQSFFWTYLIAHPVPQIPGGDEARQVAPHLTLQCGLEGHFPTHAMPSLYPSPKPPQTGQADIASELGLLGPRNLRSGSPTPN